MSDQKNRDQRAAETQEPNSSDKQEKKKQLLAWVPLFVSVVSLLSALLVAQIGQNGDETLQQKQLDAKATVEAAQSLSNERVRTLEIQTEIADQTLRSQKDQLDAAIRRDEVSLAQDRFDAEERERRDLYMKEYVPNLLGSNPEKRAQAAALLFVVYPSEAEYILQTVAEAASDSEIASSLKDLAQEAYLLARTAGEFAIAIGSDIDLAGTKTEILNAQDHGYTPTVYKKGDFYVTTVGPFMNGLEAERQNIVIRREIWPSAYTVNLANWCEAGELQAAGTISYFPCQDTRVLVHVMQFGDTLFDVAQRYGVTPMSLARANNIASPNAVFAGQRLLIPLAPENPE